VNEPKEISVGEILSSARKKKRLRYKKISSELNIEESYLIALEEENYSFIPGGEAYVKGFLRSYSKKLNLDPEMIIRSFVASKGKSIKKDINPQSKLKKFSNFRSKFIVSFILTIAFLSLIYIFTRGNQQDNESVVLNESSITIIENEFITNNENLKSLSISSGQEPGKSILIDDKMSENDLEVNEKLTRKEKAIKNSTILKVFKECWLEVYTPEERLLYKLSQPGEVFSFQEEKLKVIVGNFKNVEILFNDKIIDLERFANKNQVSCIAFPVEDCNEF
jgi:cytoskeletal protein RodZ